MASMDMRDLLRLMGQQLQPLDVEKLKYIFQDSFTEDQLAELEIGDDVAIIFEEENLLQDKQDRQTFNKALKIIGRNDIATKLEIYVAAESHITDFEDYGYTFVCHMGNQDGKLLKQNVASMPRDTEKEIEIHGGAGEIGTKIFTVAQWKTKCKSYFNRYFKTTSFIMVPSDNDLIMNALSSLCSDSKGRSFVFRNYNITKHLEFLGYTEGPLKEKLGAPITSESISYIAYIQQKNTIFICEKVSNGSSIYQSLKNIAVMVKYFLTLYDREIRASGIKVIGLLIREKENQEQLVECKFCHLFSPSYKDFESGSTFENWCNSIEIYEGWWDLTKEQIKQNKLFDDLAAEILCFMAVQKKGLPTLTNDNSKQFKQTYFLYTPQQMDIHFCDAKHVVVQGSYGSGKSILGLKKLELILKNLGRDEKIIYVNFDHKSNLHLVMEKNLKEYVKISSRKIKRTNGIRDVLGSPGQLIYVCHNSAGKNLSTILQETVRLNMSTSDIAKTNYHLIIEEYDGETLSHDEAAKVTKLVRGRDLMESHIILLAQPLMKNRSWNIGKKTYERETCMFRELENTFRIVKLEEVLRCCNEICAITKFVQNFVRNKDSVFKTKMDKHKFKQWQQTGDNKKHMVFPTVSDVKTSINEKTFNSPNDSSKANESFGRGMDLDQAFERSTPIKKNNAAKSKIVSKFGFLCEPRQGVDIKGLKPNLIEFSEDIDLASEKAVISLTLVLKNFIGKSETKAVLHMADKQPRILKRTAQLLQKLDKTFSYTQDIEEYLQKNKKSNMIFSSNFHSVNGMEFDHVLVLVSQSEYYLKYYLPQAISRCTYDLTFVLLPKEKENIKKGSLQKFSNFFSRTRNCKTKETVASIIEQLKPEYLVKQVAVTECEACEKSNDCYSISNETDNMQKFGVHTHSGQYQEHLSILAGYTQLEEKSHGISDNDLADARIQDFLRTYSHQQPTSSSASVIEMDADISKVATEIDPALIECFTYAALDGNVGEILEMLDAGVPVDGCNMYGDTALHGAAGNNNIEVVRLLLEKGANMNKKNDYGRTPLHWAAFENSTDVIITLLQQGASVNIKDDKSRTPLDWARQRNNKEGVRLLEQY